MATPVQFSNSDGATKRQCRMLKVNLGRENAQSKEQLQPWSFEDVLHATAGLCSVCLPDMEFSAIYNTLTTTTVLIALSTPEDSLLNRGPAKKKPAKVNGLSSPSSPDKNKESDESEDCPFAELFSGEETEESEGEEGGPEVDVWEKGRERFLSEAKHRATLDRNDPQSIGPEHCVLGCASLLTLAKSSKAVQLTLMAVRKRCRRLGIGRYLMQMCKDPEVVGLYDALLTYADVKAEGFFQRHGFSEDPILTAKYRAVADYWENSSLMVYVPPFSSTGVEVGSINSLVTFQEGYKKWRDCAVDSYTSQLCVMERLRHELLILHTKVQSQEDMIGELTSQLKLSRDRYYTLEGEFIQYRKHTQKLLCSAAVDNAESWLKNPTKAN